MQEKKLTRSQILEEYKVILTDEELKDWTNEEFDKFLKMVKRKFKEPPR